MGASVVLNLLGNEIFWHYSFDKLPNDESQSIGNLTEIVEAYILLTVFH